MILTDIIAKVTRYARKIIVTDNSSTTAASISQAGTGDSLSITGNAGIGASITTTTGTALKIQQNNPDLFFGGSIEIFPPSGGDFVFDGGSDGIFAFRNKSVAATRSISFSGANFGIATTTPQKTLHVNGTVRLQNLPTFANNAAAIAAGLVANDVYKTATGELRITV
jgi:hypothetical protein